MSIKIASAPCCWGVEDPKNPYIPKWETVLDEAAKAGYKGIEMGPYGYFPLDVDVVAEALKSRGLNIIAGTLFDDYVKEENLPTLLKKAEDICSFLSKLPKLEAADEKKFPGPYLVIIDIIKPERSLVAGNPEKAPRLSEKDWNTMMNNIKEVSKLAWEKYGVRPVIHPHAGGYIEFADEINKVVEDIPYETAGLCLDSGHLHYSRMDPVTWFEEKYNRIDFIHFKDIDQKVYENAIEKGTDFFQACAEKVMCPIGKGIIDYDSINKLLRKLGYNGWITLEQERDPRNSDTSLQDITESLDYLKSVGY